MKSILKLFLFMGIILISKLTKENESATGGASIRVSEIERFFTNFQQKNELPAKEDRIYRKTANLVLSQE